LAKTLANVTTEVETILNDTANTVWSEAELQSYIKEGFDDLCIQTELLWKRDTTTLASVASQATYTLPSDLYKIERITEDDIKLDPVNPEELEVTDPQYRSLTGTVYGYIVSGDGLGTLRKVRIPSGTATCVLEYVRRGATLSTGATALDIPDRHVKYVRFFALGRAYERDGPGQNIKAAEHFMTRFKVGVLRLRKRKSAVHKARVGSLGPGVEVRLSTPRLPWRYGRY
jgi:hypothetical protein